MAEDLKLMRLALRLANRGRGETSPNPLVGAVLVNRDQVIGQGWHRRSGLPHAEIEAIADARRNGKSTRGAEMFVTLEPCSTTGQTPPCTRAIIDAGIKRLIVGATDPNPAHAGRAFRLLKRAGLKVEPGLLAEQAGDLNAPFNHWITSGLPYVTLKAAMTLDAKIATATGDSRWITGPAARRAGMKLRHEADAILVGVNTIIADDPSLTLRGVRRPKSAWMGPSLRRIVLDPQARSPLGSRLLNDDQAGLTTVVVSRETADSRVARLVKKCRVIRLPLTRGRLSLRSLLRKLGKENCVHLLVEGGGETHAAFLESGLANRVTFFYAPKILGGREARVAVAGAGLSLKDRFLLEKISWRKVGPDLMLTARLGKR